MAAIIIVRSAPSPWHAVKAAAIALQMWCSNAAELAARGVKEIVLTGVNLGDFGKGPDGNKKSEENFYELVTGIGKSGRH